MNIKAASDLADVDVGELAPSELREAYLANYKRAEAIRVRALQYTEACNQIANRLGKGEFVGLCADCGAPLFDGEAYVVRERGRSYTCAAGRCVGERKLAAPVEGDLRESDMTGSRAAFAPKFARVRK